MSAVTVEFSYGTVETALMTVYGIPEDARLTFRSWLGSLLKAGLLGEAARVGKGGTLKYSLDHLHRLLLAMELSEAAVPPNVILGLVRDFWTKRLVRIFERAEQRIIYAASPADIVLCFVSTQFRSGPLSKREPVPNINSSTLGKLPDLLSLAFRDDLPGNLAPRVLAVDLSSRLRSFHAALAQFWLDEPVQPEPAGRATNKRKTRHDRSRRG